jgi:hypothetical protein
MGGNGIISNFEIILSNIKKTIRGRLNIIGDTNLNVLSEFLIMHSLFM